MRIIYKLLIFLVFSSITFIGCEPVEKAKLPANEPYLSMIRGQVSIIQPLDEKGNPKNLSGPIILLLIDKANPPPPLGLGTPNISVIPEGSIDRSFLFGKIKPGTYEIRAILDHNNNFNPLFDFYTSADSGDLAGGHIDKIDPNTGLTIFKAIEVKEQTTITNIDVLLAKEIKTNLPTFQIVSQSIETLEFYLLAQNILSAFPSYV